MTLPNNVLMSKRSVRKAYEPCVCRLAFLRTFPKKNMRAAFCKPFCVNKIDLEKEKKKDKREEEIVVNLSLIGGN